VKINWKAVILGLLSDLGVSWGLGIIIGIVWGVSLAAGGASMAEIEASTKSAPLLVLSQCAGICGSLFGGWTAAGIAKRDEIKHAIMAGVLSLLTFLAITYGVPSMASPPLYNAIGILITIPAFIAGASWRAKRNRREETQSSLLTQSQPPIPEP
jgi:hypothetical protein